MISEPMLPAYEISACNFHLQYPSWVARYRPFVLFEYWSDHSRLTASPAMGSFGVNYFWGMRLGVGSDHQPVGTVVPWFFSLFFSFFLFLFIIALYVCRNHTFRVLKYFVFGSFFFFSLPGAGGGSANIATLWFFRSYSGQMHRCYYRRELRDTQESW